MIAALAVREGLEAWEDEDEDEEEGAPDHG
jgi:hypothetical protein